MRPCKGSQRSHLFPSRIFKWIHSILDDISWVSLCGERLKQRILTRRFFLTGNVIPTVYTNMPLIKNYAKGRYTAKKEISCLCISREYFPSLSPDTRRCKKCFIALLQSWSRQVYLLQVLHLF